MRPQTAASERWQKANVDRIVIKPNKKEQMARRIEIAAAAAHCSRQAYILAAIRARLEADGITLDSLPPIAADSPEDAGEPNSLQKP